MKELSTTQIVVLSCYVSNDCNRTKTYLEVKRAQSGLWGCIDKIKKKLPRDFFVYNGSFPVSGSVNYKYNIQEIKLQNLWDNFVVARAYLEELQITN